MKLLILSLSLLLVSCNFKNEVNNKNAGTWPTNFQPYLNRFIAEGANHGRNISLGNLSISFDSTLNGRSIIGVCRFGGGLQDVTIQPDFWNRVGVEAREQLLFHELAHCLMGRGHNDSLVPFNDRPGSGKASIMSSYHIDMTLYVSNWDNYMTELFQGAMASSLTYYGSNIFPYLAYQGTNEPNAPVVVVGRSNDDRIIAFKSGSTNNDVKEFITYGEEIDGEMHIGCDHTK